MSQVFQMSQMFRMSQVFEVSQMSRMFQMSQASRISDISDVSDVLDAQIFRCSAAQTFRCLQALMPGCLRCLKRLVGSGSLTCFIRITPREKSHRLGNVSSGWLNCCKSKPAGREMACRMRGRLCLGDKTVRPDKD